MMVAQGRYNFVERDSCPASRRSGGQTLYRSLFDEGVIVTLIRLYYGADP